MKPEATRRRLGIMPGMNVRIVMYVDETGRIKA
jgi:hypothetical protein